MDGQAGIDDCHTALKRIVDGLVGMARLGAFPRPLRERMVRLGEAKPSR